MSDYFPADIWREILLKLPVESLIRCKSWNSLIRSPGFIYAHLSHSKTQSILRSFDEHDKHERYMPREFLGKHGNYMIRLLEPRLPLEIDVGCFGIVGSCDGIICLTSSYYWESPRPVILWNPSVRNHMVLPLAIANRNLPQTYLLGFGVSNNIYKVVRLLYHLKPDSYDFAVPPQTEIFSLGTKRWRRISGSNIKLGVIESMWHQVLLNGIIYWLGYDDRSSRVSILSFDIGNEVFGEVMLPDELALASTTVNVLCHHKIGGSLAVVKSTLFLDTDFDVWVMKEYDGHKSWTKLYIIDLAEECCKNAHRFFDGLVNFKNGEALMAYHGDRLVVGLRGLVSYKRGNLK